MKIVRRIIIAVVFLAIVGGVGYYKYINTITIFNDTAVNGNAIGNLYGNGLYCEVDGKVFFANPNDNDRLYVMNPDESEIEFYAEDSVYYLNSDGRYLYYSRNGKKYRDNSQFGFLNVNTDSLCRMKIKNKKVDILDDAICSVAALAGNYVVYFHYDTEEATTLYTVKIDGTEKQQLSKIQIDPRCMVGERLYYAGVENDHNLHTMNIHSKDTGYVSAENMWMPIVTGGEVYFMSLDNKERVYKMPLGGGDKVGLTSYGTSGYNIDGNYLYYQSIKGNPDGLYRVDMNTGAEQLMAEGEFNNINVTSRYVYFSDYYSGTTFHIAKGSNNVEIFNPPIESLDD